MLLFTWENFIVPPAFQESSSSSSECSALGQIFHCKLSYQAAVLPKGRSFTANLRTKVAVLLMINRCGSFPLLSSPHSLFGIWTDQETKVAGAPAWRRGEWIWLTGPSGLHRNSPQDLKISSIRVFDQIRDPETRITVRPYLSTYIIFSLFNFI